MADWLERDLANSNPHMPVIVFFHEPAFNSGKHQPNMLVRQKLTPILDKYHVDLVISGHDHNYQRTCPMVYSVSGTQCRTDGTTYIVTGGGGANLYQINPDVPDYFEATISDYNFVKLTLSDNISIQAINIDGEVIDTAGIRYK